MKNKILFLFLIILNFFGSAYSQENFTFNVTEIEILNNGNLFKGIKRGKVISNEGVVIISDNFEFDKNTNILEAFGNVIVEDEIKGIKLFGEELTYYKNKEIIKNTKRGKVISNDGVVIISDNFEFDKNTNILEAFGNVIVEDEIKGIKLFGEELTYYKNKELYW